jgi:hypothetical protein
VDTRLKSVCEDLAAIYNVSYKDVATPFAQLHQKLKLAPDSPIWNQIILALKNRQRSNQAANDALEDFSLTAPHVINDMSDGLKKLQGKFIAMFAAQDFAPAAYHFYGHGKEMSQDPGNFAKSIFRKSSSLSEFLQQLTNALGAAHDIIQGTGQYSNEEKSAEIFKLEAQEMINNLIRDNKYSAQEIESLTELRDKTIPFVAEECIVNATYLVFDSDKRDFDNILTQIDRLFAEANSVRNNHSGSQLMLSQNIAAMKLSLALADTRRASLAPVLSELQMLRNIPAAHSASLTLLLKAAGILPPAAELPKLDDITQLNLLQHIEGFLLRLGQNVRMTSELAVHLFKDPARKNLIKEVRTETGTADINTHLMPFIESITARFGEASFAAALGKLDNSELIEQVKYLHLEDMVNATTFNYAGWNDHAIQLMNLHENIASYSQVDKQKIAEIIYFVAAKSPGHKVGQETYDAMQEYRRSLSYTNPRQAEVLLSNLREIEIADASIQRTPVITRNDSHNRQRLSSMPSISPPPGEDLPRADEKKAELPPLSYEIKPERQRATSAPEKKDVTLPPIQPRKRSG